jgi:pilus assembly protein CpaC
MLFANHTPTIRPLADVARKLVKLAAAYVVAVPLSLMAMQERLAAGDFDYAPVAGGRTAPPVEVEDDGRFVRIGLNKSVVIRLPTNAHDVIVGNPDIVDAVVRTKNTAYLFARKVGQTNIFFFDDKGRQIMNIDLEVALDMTALQKLLKRSIPDTKITVDTVDNTVVLGGTSDSPAEVKLAEDLASKFVAGGAEGTGVVNMVKMTGNDQVMVKVRVVEIQRDVLKQFGVNLENVFKLGKFAFNLSNFPQFSGSTTGRIANGGGFGGFYENGSDKIGGTLRMMERDGVLRTLAEPTLTAVSGQSANFLAGGQFFVPTQIAAGAPDDVGSARVSPFEFGVGLGFTPVVLSEGRISLKIKTEVSELSNELSLVAGNITIPGITKRTAETVVELPSGGSMMLAGLIKDQMRQSIDGTPYLKKLPILGTLFRSRNYIQNQTELVVIVTPYLVNPTHERELTTPDANFNVATDRQSNFFGRLNKVYGSPGKQPDGVYHGKIGFIVE